MRTLKDWMRLGGAVALLVLGVMIALFYRHEEFGLLLGIASISVGLGFLWHIMNQRG